MARGLFDLTGKVTLVTGGNSGIGLGFARGAARQGGDVVVWARSEEKNAAARAELEALGAGRVTTRSVDVTSREAIVAGYAQLIADHGRIDCVFANAGRSSRNLTGSTLDLDEAEWHDLLATSLHGAFFTLQEGARHMVARAEAGDPGGSLVFCGSLSMFQGVGGISNYTAAKGALGAVIRAMAVELGRHGIRANTIAPGFVVTGIMGPEGSVGDDHPIVQHFASRTPIPRAGKPADFEGIAAYLASDVSAFHTGDTIVIDGGALVHPSYAF
jgi:NAD(P)-dependent dehydrogenase (short-subunit alcohol dehydrogenase family)